MCLTNFLRRISFLRGLRALRRLLPSCLVADAVLNVFCDCATRPGVLGVLGVLATVRTPCYPRRVL